MTKCVKWYYELSVTGMTKCDDLGYVHTAMFKTGNGNEGKGTGNGERGTGNGERGTGNGERGTGNL